MSAPITCKRFEHIASDEACDYGPGGYAVGFFYEQPERWLFVRVPEEGNPAGIIFPCRIYLEGEEHTYKGHWWTWDGNEEKPTITPSLWMKGTWHGWLREGLLVSA